MYNLPSIKEGYICGRCHVARLLKQGLSLAGFLALSDSVLPVLAQEETDVPFTDYPASFTSRWHRDAAADL